jgi:DNA-dependent RNA polymerase auxiliary subunit epsilon
MKPIKIYKIQYIENEIERLFAKDKKQTVYIEGKNKRGAIGNLKNKLYNNYIEVLAIKTVM